MVGKLQEAFVSFLRNAPFIEQSGVNVALSNTSAGLEEVVNTPLPAVVIHVERSESPAVCIGGMIIDHFLVVLSVITDFINYSLSEDEGVQVDTKNLPYDIRNLIECGKDCEVWDELRHDYDLSMVYNGMSWQKAKATNDGEELAVDNVQIVYACTCTDRKIREGETAKLQDYSIVLQDFNLQGQA